MNKIKLLDATLRDGGQWLDALQTNDLVADWYKKYQSEDVYTLM